MQSTRREKTVSSALWSAYGDILGFPTELVDEAGVLRRIGERQITRPKPWKRLVGGRGGAWVELPAGAYSDDTQLRLATSRAIRSGGYFDVEAFAKIELPVWLSYALGAGRGSKVGAAALSQRSVNWFTNFFEQKDVIYTSGGGNGAAMRVQPHVWAAQDLGNPISYLPDVLQNSICTHGHPRGIAGSVLHAVCLAHILNYGEIPPPSDWKMFGSFISVATELIEENPDLSTFWLPTWSNRTGTQFAEEMERVRFEWERDVEIAERILSSTSRRDSYNVLLDSLGGRSSAEKGSGIKCSLFSLSAAWIYRSSNPSEALVAIANSLGSDTDTIGTMAGALLGALNFTVLPLGPVQDREYIVQEAERMVNISQEMPVPSFAYPDLMEWNPPRSQLEVVTANEREIFVAGLGVAVTDSEQFMLPRAEASWQWLELSFGQKILCKRRAELMSSSNRPALGFAISHRETRSDTADNERSLIQKRNAQIAFKENSWNEPSSERAVPCEESNLSHEAVRKRESLDDLTDRIIRGGFSPGEVGQQLLSFADRPDGLELSIAYAAVIVKARKARLKRQNEEKIEDSSSG